MTNKIDYKPPNSFVRARTLCIAGILASTMIYTSASAQTANKDLAVEILDSCLITYAEAGSCTTANWSKIQKTCNIELHPGLLNSTTLKNGVENGLCNATGFSAFSKAVIDDLYPN